MKKSLTRGADGAKPSDEPRLLFDLSSDNLLEISSFCSPRSLCRLQRTHSATRKLIRKLLDSALPNELSNFGSFLAEVLAEDDFQAYEPRRFISLRAREVSEYFPLEPAAAESKRLFLEHVSMLDEMFKKLGKAYSSLVVIVLTPIIHQQVFRWDSRESARKYKTRHIIPGNGPYVAQKICTLGLPSLAIDGGNDRVIAMIRRMLHICVRADQQTGGNMNASDGEVNMMLAFHLEAVLQDLRSFTRAGEGAATVLLAALAYASKSPCCSIEYGGRVEHVPDGAIEYLWSLVESTDALAELCANFDSIRDSTGIEKSQPVGTCIHVLSIFTFFRFRSYFCFSSQIHFSHLSVVSLLGCPLGALWRSSG